MEAHPVGTAGQTGGDAEKQFKDNLIGMPADYWDLSRSDLLYRPQQIRSKTHLNSISPR